MNARLLALGVSSLVVATAGAATAQVILPPTVPADFVARSGLRGTDPAVAHDHVGTWHVVFGSSGDTIDWAPAYSIFHPIGPELSSYSGVGYQVAAASRDGQIVAWDLARQTWYKMGKGQLPSSFKDYIAWHVNEGHRDTGIGWGASLTGGGPWDAYEFLHDGLYQGPPSLYGSTAAFAVSNGSQSWIEVWDLVQGVQVGGTFTPGSDPSLWDRALVFASGAQIGGGNTLIYTPDYLGGAEVHVPVAGSCKARLPRLGGEKGTWVVYEAYSCSPQIDHIPRLYLANMETGRLWLIGLVASPNGKTPQYSIVTDKLVYVDGATGEVVYIDLDEDAI